MRREFLICASAVLFILPLCFSSRIDFLKYVSPVGVVSVVYVIVLIVYEYLYGEHPPSPVKQQPDQWSDVFLVVPAICFGYQVYKFVKSFFKFDHASPCVITVPRFGSAYLLVHEGTYNEEFLCMCDSGDCSLHGSLHHIRDIWLSNIRKQCSKRCPPGIRRSPTLRFDSCHCPGSEKLCHVSDSSFLWEVKPF